MGDIHAFSWTPAGGIVDIGTLGGETRATDVNDHGVVAGFSYWRSTHLEHAFRWTQAGGLVDLPGLGGPDTAPNDVNERGEIVGYSSTGTFPYYVRHPVLWRPEGTVVQLPDLGGGQGIAYDVNDSGEVVGAAAIAGGDWRPFAWSAGGGIAQLGDARGKLPRAPGRSTRRARSPATARKPAPEPTRTRPCGRATSRRPLRSRSRPSPATERHGQLHATALRRADLVLHRDGFARRPERERR